MQAPLSDLHRLLSLDAFLRHYAHVIAERAAFNIHKTAVVQSY